MRQAKMEKESRPERLSRSKRSTTTPATGEARIRGSTEAAINPPMSAVEPVLSRIQKPRAIAYTTSPRIETNCPCQRKRKFFVQTRRRPHSSPVRRLDEVWAAKEVKVTAG